MSSTILDSEARCGLPELGITEFTESKEWPLNKAMDSKGESLMWWIADRFDDVTWAFQRFGWWIQDRWDAFLGAIDDALDFCRRVWESDIGYALFLVFIAALVVLYLSIDPFAGTMFDP